MKKIVFVILIAFGAISLSQAQEVGLRFGNVSGGYVGIDGVFSTGKFSRIHADVSFGDGVGIDVLWDFLCRPLGNEAFNWYVGAGSYIIIGSNFDLGVTAEIGLEYRFNGIPLALGVDYRPYFQIIDTTTFDWGGFGLNIRWVFGG